MIIKNKISIFFCFTDDSVEIFSFILLCHGHYIISHEIRKKLGIDEHETNIGLYIRRQMKKFEK